ncbi:prolyl oligopeptidase family serine peptidase [Saccharibacillus sp. CPCC 101409]|uniref:alpha/beta hydrolase family protein n=1 Tax=Saccharibacillus sp. CPCC 101409 TaxID=3058041 RepID=UPI002671926B|nr:prolyl oligopeptidase family serine peptidase [Saccharibacillus sp. CPCC 101409]MDO3411775.1 prolyl oligopeptidase family serine peptidase [Saccharibacillus sp. CPCC 101409]
MIYRVTYLSDGLRVTGYAALPPEIEVSEKEIATWLRRECGDLELTAEAVACVLPRAVREAEAYREKVRTGRGLAARESDSSRTDGGKRRYPVFVYCRGGIGRVGRVRLDWMAEFASFGHIAVAPCYRGGESGVGRDEFGGADLEDSRVAVRLARKIPFADPGRVAVMGFSRGSINAADAAVNERTARLVLWGGLSDLAQTYEERIDLRRMMKRVIGGSAYKLPDVYRERSPIHMASRIHCPVLIVHGTEDAQVDFGHGQRMYAELKRLGKNADFEILQGLGHHMPRETRMEVLARIFAWLETGQPGKARPQPL